MPVDQPASTSTFQFQLSSLSMPVDQPASASTSQFQPPKKSRGGTTNPVYLFYERVELNADGNPGGEGDKHYKCYHGDCNTLMITKAMKSSLNEGVTRPAEPENDEDAAIQDGDEDSDSGEEEDELEERQIASDKALLSAVCRLRRIVRAVQSSLQ
ncbi:hypothetical protein B0H14DRAFT_2646806 [Mycena olivaceomarginata]|nr:hypothetical protein B0H14DRAFT_2646806 [Mycena olivaceomarginata]